MTTGTIDTSGTAQDIQQANRATAIRFIEAFNTDEWDTVREIVAPGFVFHHPIGGTVQAGPDGMASTWAGFKAVSPDAWHPIPVLIAEGDQVATLLPTYGHFSGEPYAGQPATGAWIEYGMVNIVRFEDGQIAEAWFGMDSLVEMQQMGLAPAAPPRALSSEEIANLEAFDQTVNVEGREYDRVTAFNDVVVALGPPQQAVDTATRHIEVYRFDEGEPTLMYSHALATDPPYAGDPAADTEVSRALIQRWVDDILLDHDLNVLNAIASPHLLVHPTAMPCEAGYYGVDGAQRWILDQWVAFPDLTIVEHITVAAGDIVAARWTKRGTSRGPFVGLPPTGEAVEYTGTSMFRIEDGRIAEIWEAQNSLGIMRQLNPEIGGAHQH